MDHALPATKACNDLQLPQVTEKSAGTILVNLKRAENEHTARVAAANARVEAERAALEAARQSAVSAGAELEATLGAELEQDWQQKVLPLWQEIQRLNETAGVSSPEWSRQSVEAWTPSPAFIPAIQFGRVEVDLSAAGVPADPRFALPDPPKVSVPLSLTFPEQGSLVLETNDSGDAEVIGAMHNVLLRLLAGMPPGKLSLTLIDPVGLGENFAGFMHLADYEESLINRRIWTQREQIEERLAFLNEHIEKMIQMYLRNEYATITEYNAQAGSVAEKYHILVVADFPANFSDVAVKRLQSIVSSGARCGVFVLLHWDRRQTAPEGLVAEELRKNSVCLRR
ncbi:MAG: ATP-binding protein, partial [Chitinophagaceae bacterium]